MGIVYRAVVSSLLLEITNGNNELVRVLSSLGAKTDHLNELYLQQFLRQICQFYAYLLLVKK